jgi:hypothetical protein
MAEPIPRCEDCHRPLRAAESRARKVGPKCWADRHSKVKRRRAWRPAVRVSALRAPEEDDALLDREVCGG